MGCYGLGLSRILAASVEVLSTEKELRWPDAIVPFTVCIVCPKDGSREAEAIGQADLNLYDDLIEELNLVRYFYLFIFILLWEANLHVKKQNFFAAVIWLCSL
jgi:hypothetical protein